MKNTIEFAQNELEEFSNSFPTETWQMRKEKQRMLAVIGVLLGVLMNIGTADIQEAISD